MDFAVLQAIIHIEFCRLVLYLEKCGDSIMNSFS